MKVRINGAELACSGTQIRAKDTQWDNRESIAVTIPTSYAQAVATFVDDTPWSVLYEGVDDDGMPHVTERDMSDYAISGPVTDNRDGTVTIRMGKPLPEEIIGITLAQTPKTRTEAAAWRSAIETAMQSIEDDAVALAAAPLYPEWGQLLTGRELTVGMRIRHGGKLYRVITAHTVSPDWAPGVGTDSLFTRIDETHAGTSDDPIPYEGNMALTQGLHYTQDGVVYLCNRDTVSPVYNALADLVGLYVEVV